MKDRHPLHDKWGGFFCKLSSFQEPTGVFFLWGITGPGLWLNGWTRSLILICEILKIRISDEVSLYRH